MSTLSELYITMESLRKLNLPIDERLQQEAAKLEEDLIRQEILPTLTDKIEPALAQVRRELVLVVDYVPGQPLKVSLSRKRNISAVLSDAVEIKPDPQVEHRTFGPQATPKSEIASKTILSITLPDGRVIRHRKAKDTFIDVIKEIGIERIRPLGVTFCKIPIISNTRDAKYGKAQHPIGGGWLVLTHSSTYDKKKMLDKIAKLLNIPLRVEILDTVGRLVPSIPSSEHNDKRARFSLNGSQPLKKNRSVLEAVRLFLKKIPTATYEEVLSQFPRHLQGSYGVVRTLQEVNERSLRNRTENDRWFLDPSEILTAADGVKFVVSTEWGDNYPQFQKHIADSFGWTLEEV